MLLKTLLASIHYGEAKGVLLPEIKCLTGFSSICPASAVYMVKELI